MSRSCRTQQALVSAFKGKERKGKERKGKERSMLSGGIMGASGARLFKSGSANVALLQRATSTHVHCDSSHGCCLDWLDDSWTSGGSHDREVHTICPTCRKGYFSADANDGDRICLIMLPMLVYSPVLTTIASTSSSGSSACHTCHNTCPIVAVHLCRHAVHVATAHTQAHSQLVSELLHALAFDILAL